MARPEARPELRPRKRIRPPPGAPRQVRIIGGRWKRSLLPVADVENLRPTPDRVRETLFNWLGQRLDGATVLDLFAGTGALGFEAASRGAASVVLVENQPRAWRQLEASRARLGAESVIDLVRDDADRWLDRAIEAGRRFDLVLLDPPFGDDRLGLLLPRIRRLLAPGGEVYVEAPCPLIAGDDAAGNETDNEPGTEPGTAPRNEPRNEPGTERENATGDGVQATSPGRTAGASAREKPATPLSGWRVLRAGRAGQVHYHLLGAVDATMPGPDDGSVLDG